MVRQSAALLALAALVQSPAAGFDTFWHSQCSQKVGEQFGFTADAWKILQIGNFSADFFGPVSELASKNLTARELDLLNQSQANDPRIRGAALFLHFDNLNGDLRSNGEFDYLFKNLLANTQAALAGYNQLRVDDRLRRTLTLITLGASLHAVQDFYSHSDWTHNDFTHTDLMTPNRRAPTWFEFRARHQDPEKWPFVIQTGIYPPPAGVRNSHTHMNHDNSRLLYIEAENPGAPLKSQAEYHNAGPSPARGDDDSALAHQQLAVNTAIAASIEWVNKVEENADARKAIEAAKTWSLKGRDAKLGKELEAGMLTQMALSCMTGKWDGDEPPGNRGTVCRAVLDRRAGSMQSGGSKLESEIIGLAANLMVPFAMRYTGMFWDVHGQYHVLERLVDGMGSNSGRYNLDRFVGGVFSRPAMAESLGTIAAHPNPCVLAAGAAECTCYVTWSTQGATHARVFVTAPHTSGMRETEFGDSLTCESEKCGAPWIKKGTKYVFTLYDYSSGTRGRVLASVTITATGAK